MFVHNPDDTCGFSSLEEYNAAFSKLYGEKFEAASPATWDALVDNRVCPIPITPRPSTLADNLREMRDRVTAERVVSAKVVNDELPPSAEPPLKIDTQIYVEPRIVNVTPSTEQEPVQKRYTATDVPPPAGNTGANLVPQNWTSSPIVKSDGTLQSTQQLALYGSVASIVGAAGVLAILVYLWRTR
jgi:hypothetical protein